jgi:hypothetical protein
MMDSYITYTPEGEQQKHPMGIDSSVPHGSYAYSTKGNWYIKVHKAPDNEGDYKWRRIDAEEIPPEIRTRHLILT